MSKRRIMWVGCGVMIAVGSYLLWINGYRSILSYAMLAICPLMHLFMHGHHGNHESHQPASKETTADSGKPACH